MIERMPPQVLNLNLLAMSGRVYCRVICVLITVKMARYIQSTRAKVAASGRNPRMFAGSQPGALLQSACQLNTTLRLNTTLWLTIVT